MDKNTEEICNYAGYDYKTDYWIKVDRSYENECEQYTVSKLINKCQNRHKIIDIGCGFGRLFPSYQPYTDSQILCDYAQHLLDQAEKELKNTENTTFIQGNMYELPIDDTSCTIALSIRTLHHLNRPKVFFKQLNRILTPNGHAILEIPNKRNFLTILRFIIGRSSFNPFTKAPHKLGDTFINFHPKQIINDLKENGFKCICTKNTNFLRHPIIKKLLPLKIMIKIDKFLQSTISFMNLSPSIIVLIKKEHSI